MGPSKRSIARLGTAMILACGTGATLAGPVLAQEPTNLPSVSIRPAETQRSDPNLGGWFVMQLAPGQTARATARITNPAEVAQHVKLYIADLYFAPNGTPDVVDGPQKDVGSWGVFEKSDLVVPARQTVNATFEVTVPQGAEPGDHIGAVVAESDAEPGGVRVVKRVATRLYVTVPGSVERSLRIERFDTVLDSIWWPREVVATVVLRNTGRIRLDPNVTVDGHEADGPETLLARARERYVARLSVPWYGGIIGLPVRAEAEDGLSETRAERKVVIPWALLMLMGNVTALGWVARRWQKRRAKRLEELQSEIRRLEGLVGKKTGGLSYEDGRSR